MADILKSKLVSTFKTLQSEELKRIELMLHTALFNSSTYTIALFEYLKECKVLTPDNLDRSLVKQKIFGNTNDSDGLLRKTMSELLKVFNEYFFSMRVSKDNVLRDLSICKELRLRKLDSQYASSIVKVKKTIDQLKGTDDYYYYNFKLNEERYNYLSSKKREPSILIEFNNSLNDYFLFQKLSLATIAANERVLFNAELNDSLLKEILKFLNDNPSSDGVITLYKDLYYLVAEESEPAFYGIKKSLFNKTSLSSDIRKQILALLINYCVKSINKQKEGFLEEVFSLYNFGIEREILLVNKMISPYTYRNVSVAAIKLKKFEWAENFIKEYKGRLLTPDPESYYAHCMARLLFAESKFEEALQFIDQSQLKDLFLNLSVKVIKLKIHYELDKFDLAWNLNESFRKLISRKKLLAYHKTNFQSFNRYFGLLLKLNLHDKNDKKNFLDKVQTESSLHEKEWFLRVMKS